MNDDLYEFVSKEVGNEFYEIVENYFTSYPRRFNQVLDLFKNNVNDLILKSPDNYNERDVEYVNTLNKLVEGSITIDTPIYKYLLDEAKKLDSVLKYNVNRIFFELVDCIDYFLMGIANKTFKCDDYIIFRNEVLGKICKLSGIPLDKLTLGSYLASICKSLKA